MTNKQRKILKLSVIICLLGIGLSALQAQTMHLKEYSGAQATYNLSDILKLSFPEGYITVHKTGGIAENFDLTNVRYLKFTDISTNINSEKKLNLHPLLLVYPNPVRDLLNIQWESTENQKIIVEIYSLGGKLIYKETISSPTNLYQIQVSTLPKGMFLCRIINGRRIETKKIIKL